MRISVRYGLLGLVLTAATLPVAAAGSGQFKDLLNKVKQSTHTSNSSQLGSNLPSSDIAAGLKEALAKGTTNAINSLGRDGGFWNNSKVRIPLPGKLEQAGKLARQLGQGAKVDAFELSMNRAAEKAVPQVAEIFGDAIRKMTLSDARGILTGGDHAATDFFRRVAGDALTAAYTWAMKRKPNPAEALRWGVAAGTASAKLPGMSFASLEQTQEIYRQVEVRRVE